MNLNSGGASDYARDHKGKGKEQGEKSGIPKALKLKGDEAKVMETRMR